MTRFLLVRTLQRIRLAKQFAENDYDIDLANYEGVEELVKKIESDFRPGSIDLQA